MMKDLKSKVPWFIVLVLSITFLVMPAQAMAKHRHTPPWWEVVPEEEVDSEYYDSILYSEIAPKLPKAGC